MNKQTKKALKMSIKTMKSTKLGNVALGLSPSILLDDTINACKEALEQPPTEESSEAEPVQDYYALDTKSPNYVAGFVDGEIAGKSKALEQPAQEPVTWISQDELDELNKSGSCLIFAKENKEPDDIPLYTHPHQCQECENLKHDLEGYMDANKELLNREWQGLTDDEILKTSDGQLDCVDEEYIKRYARAIEQALSNKNTV